MLLPWKTAKRLVISVIGGTVLLIGVIGILTPVLPGFIFIPMGLAILATEFVWAKRWLQRIKEKTKGAFPVILSKESTQGSVPTPPDGQPEK